MVNSLGINLFLNSTKSHKQAVAQQLGSIFDKYVVKEAQEKDANTKKVMNIIFYFKLILLYFFLSLNFIQSLRKIIQKVYQNQEIDNKVVEY